MFPEPQHISTCPKDREVTGEHKNERVGNQASLVQLLRMAWVVRDLKDLTRK